MEAGVNSVRIWEGKLGKATEMTCMTRVPYLRRYSSLSWLLVFATSWPLFEAFPSKLLHTELGLDLIKNSKWYLQQSQHCCFKMLTVILLFLKLFQLWDIYRVIRSVFTNTEILFRGLIVEAGSMLLHRS